MLQQESKVNGLFPTEERDLIATFYLKASEGEILAAERELERGNRYSAMEKIEDVIKRDEPTMMGSKNLIWQAEGVHLRRGADAKRVRGV